MRRKTRCWWLAAALVTGLTSVACGNAQDGGADTEAAQQAQWTELERMKGELDAKRAELTAAREELRAALAQPAGDGAATAEALSTRVQQLEAETQQLADEFNTELVTYINANAPVAGEPRSEQQQAAIRMKSAEDMLYAREYIEEGGDFSRAIDIYKAALTVDPDNEDLQQGLVQAETARYMTAERFDTVENGMNAEQVRAAIGTPFYRNVREFDGDVVAWFYPTGPDRSAAAVWFKKGPGDSLEVYKSNFTEVAGGTGEVAGNGQAG